MKRLITLFTTASLSALYAGELTGKVPLIMEDVGIHRGPSRLDSPELLQSILNYLDYGALFTMLQAHWFRTIFAAVILGVVLVFALHYFLIGPKVFSHEGKKFKVFSLFMRIVHWIAAFAFILIVPTGLMMIFGEYLGGGTPVRYARYLHSIGTVLFIVAVIPMFLVWLKPMIISRDDIKWALIGGGYLSKKKREVPAGKFNAGQKFWFWVATLGGFVMIATGAAMYFQDFDLEFLRLLPLTQIDLLRIAAIVHNLLGVLIVALFITHLYMSIFAIKGALDSMISGEKSEDELKHLHGSYYKNLLAKEARDKKDS